MSDTPYVISGTGADDQDARVVTVFAVPNPAFHEWVSGEDEPEGVERPSALIEYTMPADINPVIGLEYGEKSETNPAAAGVWLIKEVIGEEGYRALVRECKKMSPKKSAETIKTVSEKIATAALGN